MPLLTLTDVTLAFGHVPLFESAQLQIDSGERIALIGRNGSGKSSLLRVISGEVPPDTGNVWRAPGVRVARLDQDVPLVGTRTVFEEIAAGDEHSSEAAGEHGKHDASASKKYQIKATGAIVR